MAKKDKAKKHEAESTRENGGQQVTADSSGGDAQDKTEKKTGSNAPRARKWDYGIKREAQVVRLVETANVKRDIQAQFAHTEGDPLVSEFYSKGGDRHGLRVMSRRKLIKIVHKDDNGNVVAEFPQGYTKPEPKPAEEKAEATA